METQALIAHILEHEEKGVSGRIALQKLVYFCKTCGVNVDANYRLYIYGPYSQQVADSLQDGVEDSIFKETNGHIERGNEFEEYYDGLSGGNALGQEQQTILSDVLGTLGNKSPKELEILATTFFIDLQQRTLFGSADKEDVLSKVTHAKETRFTKDEILNSYTQMEEICRPLVKRHMPELLPVQMKV